MSSSHFGTSGDEDEEARFGSSGGEESKSKIPDYPDNEFYHFLNVPRDATDEQISAAYKKLTRLYHPDKHLDPESKKKAEVLFAKLKRAHEVLLDPRSRAIYDCLGKEGLKVQGWEVVPRTKTPREIREEYEQLAKERAERRLQQRTNPTSRLTLSVDATDLFDRYRYSPDLDEAYDDEFGGSPEGNNDDGGVRVPSLEVTEIGFGQTVECPITNADNVVLSGNVSTRNGTGNGSVACCWRRVHSASLWHEVDASVGGGPKLGAKVFKRITAKSFANVAGSFQSTNQGLKPHFSASLGNQLSRRLVGQLTYNTTWGIRGTHDGIEISEEDSGVCTSLVYNHENYRLMAAVQFGIPYTYVALTAMRKFSRHDSKVRGALRFGTFGAIAEYGVERQVTRHSVLGATVVVGVPVGVTLRIKLTRGQQIYLFPLKLADEVLLEPIFYGTTVPLVLYFAFKKLVLDPFERKRRRAERDKQMAACRERISESRKEAEASIDLMRQRFSRIRQDEQKRDGLIIVLALYGRLSDEGKDLLAPFSDFFDVFSSSSTDWLDYGGCVAPAAADAIRQASLANATASGDAIDGSGKSSEAIDVTIPVQCLVEDNSRLTLFEGTKSDLAGFYDPTPSPGKYRHGDEGEEEEDQVEKDDLDDEREKQLLVLYLYQGARHRVVVGDREGLRIPRNAHRIGV